MKKGFLSNKYTLSVIILLAILGVDVLLHKGMSRVMLPASFTEKRKASLERPRCSSTLTTGDKHWSKAVNSIATVNTLDSTYGGIEMDVYFDTAQNTFLVYHDSIKISNTKCEEILTALQQLNKELSIWFDFKNLNDANLEKSIVYLTGLRDQFDLQSKMIVESSNAQLLSSICEKGFYTSYYIPFFNPYKDDESALVMHIDNIGALIKKYPINSLSGYYFQAPFLRKYFPNFPVLTWTDQPSISLVANVFNRQLLADEGVKIVLYPSGN